MALTRPSPTRSAPTGGASLRLRALLAVFLVGLLGVGASLVLDLRQESRRLQEQVNAELAAMPLLYAGPLAQALSQPETLQPLLHSMLARHGMRGIELRTASGERHLAGELRSEPGAPETVFKLLGPRDRTELGSVRVLAGSQDWRATLANERLLGLTLQNLLLLLLLCLAIALVLERSVLRPLRRLTERASQFDPTHSEAPESWLADEDAPREVRQLNKAFERVHRSLDERLQDEIQRVAQLHAEIETRERALMQAEQRLQAQQRELASLSRVDALTGLRNQGEFTDSLRREFKRAQRMKSELALAVLDLDHFKRFNQQHGHAAGDARLQAFARLLSSSFKRDTDLLARLGGEEFVVLLPGLGLATAQQLLEQLRTEWRDEALAAGTAPDAVLTVSIGLAAYSPAQPYLSPQALMQAADEALYVAKHTGRDRLSRAA